MKEITFSINNAELERLKPYYQEALQLVTKSIKGKSMIILRHHADTDGYAAGFCLENALVPMMSTDNLRYVYKRAPSKTPFYDYGDMLKDLDTFSVSKEFGRDCLLILTDMGSGEESTLSLERMKAAGITILIIDHHVMFEDTVKMADININPHIVGGNSELCAGILCYEFGRQLTDKLNPIFPALATVADKSKVSDYIKRYDLEYLRKIVICIEFEAFNLRYMETDAILDLFNEKKDVIAFLHKEISRRMELQKAVVEKYMEKSNVNGITVMKLNIESLNPSDFYGVRSVGMMSGLVEGPKVAYGYGDAIVKFRADNVNFKLSDLIKGLKENFPSALVSGGGHDMAGAIRFLPVAKNDVLGFVDKYISGLKPDISIAGRSGL
jgi:RecJ-like exonuclease